MVYSRVSRRLRDTGHNSFKTYLDWLEQHDGPDLAVRHAPKDIPADSASTGEQKALLIGLMLAHARLVRQMSGIAPLVLLDEVAAHLDPSRRTALYARLGALGSVRASFAPGSGAD